MFSYIAIPVCNICINRILQHPESTEGNCDDDDDDRDLSDTDDGSDQPFMVSYQFIFSIRQDVGI